LRNQKFNFDGEDMSVQKKSLISQRSAVKSAILATPETSNVTPAARPSVKPALRPNARPAIRNAKKAALRTWV
jgi:hypothetical protein